MEHTTIAVDLAKSVFQVAVSHRPGSVDDERRLPRDRFLAFFAQQPPATIVLEACGSAHYWARQLQPLGHAVHLLPPHDVRPYVRRNKADRTDAKGLLEAHRNEEIHPVPVKTIEHQALASLHRLRSTWLATRTARLNTIRGLLREFRIFIPVGSQHVVPRVRALVEEPAVPRLLHTTLVATCDEIEVLEVNMRAVERQLAALVSDMPDAQLLQTVPGVGLITATALVALVTDIRRFPSGRHFASFLGLTPREDSSALRRRLGAITKQGDVYVRMLLTHGARSVVWHAKATGASHAAAAVGGGDRAPTWTQCRRRRRRQRARSDRVGGLGAPAALRGRAPSWIKRFRSSLSWRLHRALASWRHRSDRREDTPITALAAKAVQAIGPSRADSMMARSHTAPRTRPKIRLQSDCCAATPGESNCHDATGGRYATKEKPSSR